MSKGVDSPAMAKKISALRDAVARRDWVAARPLAATLLKRAPQHPDALALAAATAADGANDPEGALRHARAALALQPDHWIARRTLCSALISLGDVDGAADAADRLIALDPENAAGYCRLLSVAPERGEAHLPKVEALLVSPSLSDAYRAALFTELGRVLERRGRMDAAYAAYATSKRLLNRPYSGRVYEQALERARAVFTRRFFAEQARPEDADWDDGRMVFVSGMPRSGSTLLERILVAHSDVASLGETAEAPRTIGRAFKAVVARRAGPGWRGVPAIDGAALATPEERRRAAQDYLQRAEPFLGGAVGARWLDKMTANFVLCGSLAAILPRARFLLTERDPRDIMASSLRVCFSQGQAFTESFERFAHHYRLQQAFTSLWLDVLGDRVAVVPYEALVAAPERRVAAVLDHLGLPWQPACLTPERSGGAVRTASALQIRKPIHSGSVGGWRKFEGQRAAFEALRGATSADAVAAG